MILSRCYYKSSKIIQKGEKIKNTQGNVTYSNALFTTQATNGICLNMGAISMAPTLAVLVSHGSTKNNTPLQLRGSNFSFFTDLYTAR